MQVRFCSRTGVVVFALAALVLSACSSTPADPDPPPSLYQRLGGEAGLAALLDSLQEFSIRNEVTSANPLVVARAQLRDPIVFRRFLTQFFTRMTGGPELYEGRSLADSHGVMKITEIEWDAARADWVIILAQHDIAERESAEFLALFDAQHDDVVTGGPGDAPESGGDE